MERKNADKTFLKGNKNNGKNISSNPIKIPKKTKKQKLTKKMKKFLKGK